MIDLLRWLVVGVSLGYALFVAAFEAWMMRDMS